MKPLIIGIAGGSGCGKSSFSEALRDRLSDYNVYLLHMDNYFRDPLPQVTSPITGLPGDDFNHPDAVDFEKPLNLIRTIQSDGSYDIVIVEGAFLFCYDEMRPLFDLKVFIDLDADARMYRRIRRNTGNFTARDGWGNVDFQFEYYLNYAKFQEQKYALPSKVYADIILNGYRLDGPATEVLLAWVRSGMGK
ncbi:MAG: hypothetical protein FWF44_00505 [Defluviitaleaceae bacterium]|nr:hypothetical protein [Defluviitaleaceae bacterium]